MGFAASGIGEINETMGRDTGDRAADRPGVSGRPGISDQHSVTDRLVGEFPILPASAVRRQVEDARVCVRQLGLEATPWLVERVAREHLTHFVRSRPPSGRVRPISQ